MFKLSDKNLLYKKRIAMIELIFLFQPTPKEKKEWPIERIKTEWVIPSWVELIIKEGKKFQKDQ